MSLKDNFIIYCLCWLMPLYQRSALLKEKIQYNGTDLLATNIPGVFNGETFFNAISNQPHIVVGSGMSAGVCFCIPLKYNFIFVLFMCITYWFLLL